MNAMSCHSNHSSMPAWVTISEAAAIINQQQGICITDSDVWRYALYGHLTLSIYFQSPVRMRRIKIVKDSIVLTKVKDDIIGKLCNLSPECLLNDDYWMVKTEGDYISPKSFIVDTPLMGHECIELQRRLALSLDLPPPETGRCNIHCGIIVRDGNHIFQLAEYCTVEQRIDEQLHHLPPSKTELFNRKIDRQHIQNHRSGYFPLYNFPADAWFVIRRTALEQFISHFFKPEDMQEKPTRLSTPVSRLLWLACKHNDHISQLVDHPYKLLSVFEQWALTDGITDRLSGNTLKTALERGSPLSGS